MTGSELHSPRQFRCHATALSQMVSREVLSGESYPIIPFIENVKLIVDVGANIGASAVYFRHKYPDAKIVAYEPHEPSFELLVDNTAGLNVTCIRTGLAGKDCTAKLYHGCHDSAAGSTVPNKNSCPTWTEVKLREAGVELGGIGEIDILKIDTEGCEVEILLSISQLLRGIRVMYLEFHSETDRRVIEGLLTATHMLFYANVRHPHRGEVCYVNRDHIHPDVHDRIIEREKQ